jgi:hypothetical protein
MANVLVNTVPTTEVEAVNNMLASIGEAQIAAATDLSAVVQADIVLAINILKNAHREVLTRGWRFNTENGLQLSPMATAPWVDNDGVTTDLNVFTIDPGISTVGIPTILAWKMTPCSQNGNLDLVERYDGGAGGMTLYDRWKNRPGAEASLFPKIYLNVVYAPDFVHAPESFRRYVAVLAARRFAAQNLGSDTLCRLSQLDERTAERDLKRDQGLKTKLNILATTRDWNIHGRRQVEFGGYSLRVYPSAY